MKHISPVRTALSVGYILGLLHLGWVALVASGYAERAMAFILKMHFIEFDYQMAPFNPETGVTLVAVMFGTGLAVGFIFALFWNWMIGDSREPGKAPLA